tara:strand:- start:1695 stop:3998 length:2304 start_codon:yes stop_codon:yes gene_type:complete
MNLTEAQLRNIIREELYVPNHLRAKPFSMHIFERDYVVNVLCLDVPLNESYPYSPSLERRIIQEQLMLEGFFSDILQKGKDALMSTVDGVKQFGKEAWSVLKGFYLAVKEGKTESLFRAIAQDVIKNIYIPLKKALAYLVEKLPDWKMPTFAKAAQKALDLLKGLKDKMMSAKGWQKIAMASGVAIGLTWLWEKIGDSIEELTGETDGLTLSEAEGDSKIAKIKAIIKDGWPGVFKAITGSNFKKIVEKVATASSIGPWWEAAKSVGKGAAIVTAAIGGATAKFVDDHEEGERIKKGTTKKEEQNESWYRVTKQGNDGSILYPVRQKRLAENVLLREYIRTMILEKELRGQKSKRTLYHIGKRPASPKPAERWGAKGEEGWSRDWIEGPVKSGVFLTPNPTDIAWNHGVSGNVYAYRVPHWVIEKSGGVNRFDTGSEVLISQEVWEEAGDEIEFLGKTMDKDELWDKVDSSDYSAKQKKGVRGTHKHEDGASSISGLRSTNHPEAAIKMMSQEEIKKALTKFENEYAQEGPAEVVKGPRDRKGLVVPYIGKRPRGKDKELINLLKKHMKESVVRDYVRELLTEAAKGPADLPEDVFVQVLDKGDHAVVRYVVENPDYGTYIHSTAPIGGKIAVRKPSHPCGGAWEVVISHASQGWGPMLYDVMMEWATQNGGGLVSDRDHVSPSAREVWNYYLSNRGDVQGVQLDDLRNTITPEVEDNCEQHSATIGRSSAGMPKVVDFQGSPLSKRYTKPPTTMNALEAAGKLVTT